MANRTPVDRGLGRARLQPSASPVDTFSRTTPGSGLSALAESLRSVAPEVGKYSDVLAERQSTEQKAAGEQKARVLFEQGVTYQDAIKKKLISPDESPWFQLGAKEQYGRVTAGRYSTDLQDAVEKDPNLQTSVDVADYDKFVSNFRKQWMASNVGEENRGLSFEHGFGSMADAYSEDSRRQFVAQAGGRLVKQVGDNHYGEIFTTTQHELKQNTDHSAIADGINLANQRFTAMGGDPTVANRAVVQALGDLALSTGDVSVLDILTHVKAGNQTLDARPWAQKEIQEVTHRIFEDKQQHHVADQAAAQEQKEATVQAESGDIISQWILSDNPSRLDFRDRIAALAKVDHKAAESLRQAQNVISGANFESDVVAKQSALANIFKPKGDKDYVDVNTLVNLLNTRQINAQDFIQLKSQIDDRDNAARRDANEKDAHNPYTDPQFSHAMTSLTQQITNNKPDEMWGPEVTRRANGAQAEFGKAWLEYMAGAGKDASFLDRHKFLEGTLLAITNKWQTADTRNAANQPSVPRIDLMNPAARERAKTMANVITAQTRAGTGFSDAVLSFLRANNITDAAGFAKQYGDDK